MILNKSLREVDGFMIGSYKLHTQLFFLLVINKESIQNQLELIYFVFNVLTCAGIEICYLQVCTRQMSISICLHTQLNSSKIQVHTMYHNILYG